MISPEVLQKHSFFSFLADDQFEKVARIAEVVSWGSGEQIFGVSNAAGFLYLLETGAVEMHYTIIDELNSEKSKKFFIGTINPGEAFGLSAVIEPFAYTANAIASAASTGIKIDAQKLRELAGEDTHLGYAFMAQVAKASFERLSSVRVELAAARK